MEKANKQEVKWQDVALWALYLANDRGGDARHASGAGRSVEQGMHTADCGDVSGKPAAADNIVQLGTGVKQRFFAYAHSVQACVGGGRCYNVQARGTAYRARTKKRWQGARHAVPVQRRDGRGHGMPCLYKEEIVGARHAVPVHTIDQDEART